MLANLAARLLAGHRDDWLAERLTERRTHPLPRLDWADRAVLAALIRLLPAGVGAHEQRQAWHGRSGRGGWMSGVDVSGGVDCARVGRWDGARVGDGD